MRTTNRFLTIAGFALAITLTMRAQAPATQQTFATPQEAAQAIDAAARNDTPALLKLFGPNGKDIVESGDPAQDKTNREQFAASARAKLRIDQDPTNPDRATLSVGDQDWPFPVPLVRTGGKWRFDSAAGRTEILAHRIGENEVNAVEVCRGYVEAQNDYASQDRDKDGLLQYAQKMVSTPGKHDGLYWEGDTESLVPKAFASAAAANLTTGARKPDRYHGYYFRILKAQGPDAPGARSIT
jgi:Protein of unknown function (DUF2950)